LDIFVKFKSLFQHFTIKLGCLYKITKVGVSRAVAGNCGHKKRGSETSSCLYWLCNRVNSGKNILSRPTFR